MTNMKKRVAEINKILDEMKRGMTIEYCEVQKNNILKPAYLIDDEESNVSIYLYIYKELEELTDSEIAKAICDYYEKHRIKENVVTPLEYKDFIYSHVKPRVVGTNNNSDYLKDKITVPFLDMAIIFAISITSEMSVVIDQNIYFQSALSVDKLLRCARKNIVGREVLIPINDYLADILGHLQEEVSLPVYVLNNKEGIYGAQMILNENVLRRIFNRIGEFYLIPSSIHEWLVASTKYISAEEWLELNKKVNAEVVDKEDVLTTAIYKYSETGIEKVL